MSLLVTPCLLVVAASGGTVSFKMKNDQGAPMIFKIKTSNVDNYRINPVFGYIAAKETKEIEVVRTKGDVKIDRIVIWYALAPEGKTTGDPQKVFNDVKSPEKFTVPVSAVVKEGAK